MYDNNYILKWLVDIVIILFFSCEGYFSNCTNEFTKVESSVPHCSFPHLLILPFCFADRGYKEFCLV